MAEGSPPSKQDHRVVAHLIGAVVIAAGVLAFVFQNTKNTRLRWLFFTFDKPLWVVLLVTAAASLAAGELAARALRRARDRRNRK